MDEIPQLRKLNDIIKVLGKTTQMTMGQQVMALDCLKATELRACQEALLNHRVDRATRSEESGRGRIDSGNQTQKSALPCPVVADQGNPVTMMNGATDTAQSLHLGTSACLVHSTTRQGTKQSLLDRTGFLAIDRYLQPDVPEFQHRGNVLRKHQTKVA
jgi:hypothetical protein